MAVESIKCQNLLRRLQSNSSSYLTTDFLFIHSIFFFLLNLLYFLAYTQNALALQKSQPVKVFLSLWLFLCSGTTQSQSELYLWFNISSLVLSRVENKKLLFRQILVFIQLPDSRWLSLCKA